MYYVLFRMAFSVIFRQVLASPDLHSWATPYWKWCRSCSCDSPALLVMTGHQSVVSGNPGCPTRVISAFIVFAFRTNRNFSSFVFQRTYRISFLCHPCRVSIDYHSFVWRGIHGCSGFARVAHGSYGSTSLKSCGFACGMIPPMFYRMVSSGSSPSKHPWILI